MNTAVGGREKTEDVIIISSAWAKCVAFKITSSAPHIFTISSTQGFLPPCQSTRVAVRLATNTPNLSTKPSFYVSLQEATTQDLQANSPEIFWSENEPGVRIHVSCDINRHDEEDEHYLADSHLPPTGHIMDLMVKNVSKGDPLTREEAQVKCQFYFKKNSKRPVLSVGAEIRAVGHV